MIELYVMNLQFMPQEFLIKDAVHGAAEYQDIQHAQTAVVILITVRIILVKAALRNFHGSLNTQNTTIIFAIALMLRQLENQLCAKAGAPGTVELLLDAQLTDALPSPNGTILKKVTTIYYS